MNAKQTVPLIATLAPAISAIAPTLLIGGAVFLVLKFLFPAENSEQKPETTRASGIPPNSAEIPINPPVSVSPVPQIPVPVPASVPTTEIREQTSPPPVKRRLVTRENMATIFRRGARALTRTEAVAALKSLGFGKTAAYEALSADGRFTSWLQFAPDGIITWRG